MRSAFLEDGFAVVCALAGAGARASLRVHRIELCRRQGRSAESPIVTADPTSPALEPLLTRAGRLAGEVFGGPASCFGVTYLMKRAGSGLPASWHQDGGPWRERLGGAPALTVWVALDDADADTGCLRVVPRSHSLAAQPLLPDGGASLFGVGMDPALVEHRRVVDLPLSAGDAVVHHHHLIHGSHPNLGGRDRLAVALRFAAAAQCDLRPAPVIRRAADSSGGN